jgi:hypothetical protein
VGHQVGQVVLVLCEELREAEEGLTALRGRDETPLLIRALRSGNGAVDVLGP